MSPHPKIQPLHLARAAYVYIRQSSLRQVEQHLESQDLQYQLAQRAAAWGWDPAQVVILDDDLGKSGASTTQRPGFQQLVAATALAHVGIILVPDVSRLARNCADWYQLLDLAAATTTLISDASGVYDPRVYDDRLLLGLKGTFSEAQWYAMRAQLQAARLNKAQRGELAMRLPVGYDRLPQGAIVLAPDQEVQHVIRLVFDLFDQLGSTRAVLRALRDAQLQLPHRVASGPDRGTLAWVRPKYAHIYHLLKNPAYAGAYAYGKRRTLRTPGAPGQVASQALPLEQWPVLLRDAFPGYISWDQYLRNQERLHDNAQSMQPTPGAPRGGRALLQGLVWCARCGRRMRARYRDKPAYVCAQAAQDFGAPRCQHATVAHVDAAVVQLFFEALQPLHLEVALEAARQVALQRQHLAMQWQQRRERARYEADLARRRYACVDPDNRLVAAELEQQWEDKLRVCQQLEATWTALREQTLTPLTPADETAIRQLAAAVPALWAAETTAMEDRKRLLRCLIQAVTLDPFTTPGVTRLVVQWHTGTATLLAVPRPKPGGPPAPPALLQRVCELAQTHPDDEVAHLLNTEGTRTARNALWTPARVRNFRNKHRLPTGCPAINSTPGPRGDGLLKASEAAAQLGVTPSMVADWFRRGYLIGHQLRPGAPLWVRLTDADHQRFDGSASLTPDLVPVQQAPLALGLSLEALQLEVRAGCLLTYRLRINHRWRWYVQRPVGNPQP